MELLLAMKEIVVENDEVIWRALRQWRGGKADFADCLITASARVAGCERTVTFDQRAARDAGMELLA
jgi:predicted nucleic-acid-binding protein